MRLVRAWMTRGTAVVMGVTSRPVRSVASHRRRAAASGSRATAEAPHARRGFRCATWPLAHPEPVDMAVHHGQSAAGHARADSAFSADFGWQAGLTTLTLGDRGTRGGTGRPARAQARRRSGLARLWMAAGLQRGHGRGASPSKPSIRVAWSHSPHHGGRAGRAGGAGSSAGDSRAASTAYEFRTR
jgi:hypothetical protein